MEEDQACAQALDCVEVFGTDGMDPLMDVLYGMDQEFGLPVEDQGFGLPVEDEDNDEACHRTMDQFDYQQRLLSQLGGALDQPGRLEFELQPYVDRQSTKMGVRERHFSTCVRQTGNFIPDKISPRNWNRVYVEPCIMCWILTWMTVTVCFLRFLAIV